MGFTVCLMLKGVKSPDFVWTTNHVNAEACKVKRHCDVAWNGLSLHKRQAANPGIQHNECYNAFVCWCCQCKRAEFSCKANTGSKHAVLATSDMLTESDS